MGTAEILFEIESKIIENMVRLLAAGEPGKANWQAKKLMQLGTLRAMNEKALADLPAAIEAANEEIRKRGKKAALGIDAAIDAAGPDVATDPRIAAIWKTWEGKTKTAIEKMGMTLINQSQEIYIKTIESTTARVLMGALSGRDAIAESAATWSQKGIPALVDRSGKEWTVEAYAQVVTRSNFRNVVTETQFERMNEHGLDLVEIDSHAGARPLCAPYQGKVFSLRGETKGYPTLSSTSYGDPAGLFGCNCGHNMYPYIPGTKKTYSPYPEKENKKVYAESQKQRALERSIRYAKRELNTVQFFGSAEEIESAKGTLKNREAAMKSFISETGRTRRTRREEQYDTRAGGR